MIKELIGILTHEHVNEEEIRRYESYGRIDTLSYIHVDYDTGKHTSSEYVFYYVIRVVETNLGNVTVSIHDDIHGYIGSAKFIECGKVDDIDAIVCRLVNKYYNNVKWMVDGLNNDTINTYTRWKHRHDDTAPYIERLSNSIKECNKH